MYFAYHRDEVEHFIDCKTTNHNTFPGCKNAKGTII